MKLIDSFGRTVTHLRISVTERCNLRCRYCMPAEGVPLTDESKILTYDEIERLASILVGLGIKKIRLTGGEPTVRKGIVGLVERLSRLKSQGLESLAMTTNGTLLENDAPALKAAGLNQINISLDTLKREKFFQITLRDLFDRVIRGIDKAMTVGIPSAKVNAVAMRGLNDDEIFDFVQFANDRRLTVRFIEFMPFPNNEWGVGKFIASADLKKKVEERYELMPLPKKDPSDTSEDFQIVGFPGRIGFISSVTRSFCSICSRIRLTADGQIRPCLHSNLEYDLRTPLRSGASDEEIINLIQKAVLRKWKEHPDWLSVDFKSPTAGRDMITIGG